MCIFNYDGLNQKLVEAYLNYEKFTKDTGINKERLMLLLDNQDEFSREEIEKICDGIGIKHSEIKKYFFTKV